MVTQVKSAEKQQLLQAYSHISNMRGLFDLVLHWGAILLVFFAIDSAQSVLVGVLGILVIPGLQSSLASLAHETFHHKVFTSRKLNALIGGFLYSYPVGLPYENYRKRHLQHHRDIGYRSDPDWGNYQGPQFESAQAVYKFFVAKLFGAYLFVNAFNLLSGKNPPILLEKEEESSVRDLAFLALTQLTLFVLIAVFFSWWMYFVVWLLPLVTLTAFFIGARAYLEHNDPDEDSGVDARLFDYRPNWLEHFLISPCHFHLHALHHAFPAVPHYRLNAMKFELGQRGITYPGQDRAGYIRCFFSHVRKLGKQPGAPC